MRPTATVKEGEGRTLATYVAVIFTSEKNLHCSYDSVLGRKILL